MIFRKADMILILVMQKNTQNQNLLRKKKISFNVYQLDLK